MGKMVEGVWRTDPELDDADIGRFSELGRRPSILRDRISEPAVGRYHLYIMLGCPWAHRSYLLWSIKKLRGVVSLSMLAPRPSVQGWVFDEEHRDPIADRRALHEVYAAGADRYTGRVTVPVLFDKHTGRIVNNESSDIIEMFNSSFDAITGDTQDFYPERLRPEIDALNAVIYRDVNNGVYKAGFARSEALHSEARDRVFATLDVLERRLEGRDTLVGDQLTLADWRLFPTLVRFDAAYVSAFRCNTRRLVDYPNLWRYTRQLYAHPGVAETVADPMLYRRGYHSIPFAIGHHDPLPATPLPSFA